MRASDLFEAQIANADTVAGYCVHQSSSVTDPTARAWMVKAARRFISNSDAEFLVRYDAADYSDNSSAKDYIDELVSPEMQPYLQRFVAQNMDFAVFLTPEDADDDDSEDAADRLLRQMSNVRDWLNTNPPGFQNMDFGTALRFAEAHAKKMAMQPNKNDVREVLKIGDYTWVELLTSEAVVGEGHLMQNCLKDQPRYGWNVDSGIAKVYSLRDRNGRPHVTVYANGDMVEQAKGKQNDVPKPIYQKAADLLFRHLGLKVDRWEVEKWQNKPALKEASGVFPTRSFRKLWHVGSMNAADKRKDSYEGAGLSVSVHPEEWQRIARGFVSGDTYEMTRPGNQFLDYWKIGKRRWAVIRQWAIEKGWAEPQVQYEVSWYDEEMDRRVGFVFDTREEAEAESDPEYNEDVQIKEIPTGMTGTAKLASRCHQRGPTSTPQDLLATLYAEDVLGLDGVWWNDVFDPDGLSAPRGVIVPSKISGWTTKKVRHSA